MEQMVLTDQDNALVWGEDVPEAQAYFSALAEKAIADLVAAGFPRCPGGYMSTKWLGGLAGWEERFRGWLEKPTPQALLEASIFFDFRAVHGSLDVSRLRAVVGKAREARTFLSAMAKSAVTFHPPSGLGLRLRSDSARFDMKLKGISPIVFLARVYGLESAARTSNTLDRLKAAASTGLMSEDTADTLSEAYRFFLRVRLRVQIQAISEGRPPSNLVSLSDLSSMERSRLRDAFRAIEVWQERAAYHYRTDLF
jgi:CBS domain-containing protein